ncbi:MAG: purine binding chemotaxis protein [Candidatus Scalindua rubra]|uniref:Chemotaxis protein CheW n=1 Tax=Candidatus Scalindua rubra TaxID=1872076 RepID=A0A1E3X6K3_9BACT|nr:MAG: purine binding chemotaxis protein [Candidatus Scalindua rubra]
MNPYSLEIPKRDVVPSAYSRETAPVKARGPRGFTSTPLFAGLYVRNIKGRRDTMEAVATKKAVNDEKFLTFSLGNEEYGVEILKVKEIIGLMDITTVPQSPDYMKGVINLRGKVIPIIDLRLKFSMAEAERTQETCIIVVEVNNSLIGIIVDSVSEVLDIMSEEIEETPSFGHGIDTNFIKGLGKTKGKIIILLDIEKVLTSEDIEMVNQVAA